MRREREQRKQEREEDGNEGEFEMRIWRKSMRRELSIGKRGVLEKDVGRQGVGEVNEGRREKI
jgi:hypothetical protein